MRRYVVAMDDGTFLGPVTLDEAGSLHSKGGVVRPLRDPRVWKHSVTELRRRLAGQGIPYLSEMSKGEIEAWCVDHLLDEHIDVMMGDQP